MKTAKSILLLAICTILALGLIILSGPKPSDNSGGETTAPPAEAPDTTPTSPQFSYGSAAAKLQAARELAYTYSYSQTRLVGGESFSEDRTGTAWYTGLNTNDLEALVTEDVAYGSYSTRFTESYLNGRGYSQVRGTSFVCDLSGDAFLDRQIPAVLLEESLYGLVELSEDQRTIDFSEPSALEGWADPTGKAELISAAGHVHLNDDGSLSTVSYRAEYTLGNITYSLNVAVSISEGPDETLAQPEYPENCATVSDLDIPRYMLKTVDGVYSSNSVSAEYTESLYFGVLQEWRTKTGGYYFHGTGGDFLANLVSQSYRTTSTGSNTSFSQNNIFKDGQYLCSANGADPNVDSSFTAEKVRNLCMDNILSVMMTLEHIGSATIADTGDFLQITFQANEAFIQYFSGNIFAVMGYETSLDLLADSCETHEASGYLMINKYTALPTAMGLSLGRTHVFNGISYDTTYQLDQGLTIACPNAYETITGSPLPQTEAEAIAPLFYQVAGKNGQKLWLLGIMDIGDSRITHLPSQITNALAGSDALAVEYDADGFEKAVTADSTLQSQLAALYYYENSTTADHLPQGLYEQVYPLMQATGMCSAGSQYLKPVVWASQIEKLYLTQSYGLSGSESCQRHLLQMAAQLSLPVYQMESGLSRLQMLTGLTDRVQSMLLQDLPEQGMLAYYELLSQEYELWCSGDETGLLRLADAVIANISKEDQQVYAEYYKTVFLDRTQLMCSAAKGYLESGETVFCAVNIANLLGEDGLVEALRAEGYTVEAISYE